MTPPLSNQLLRTQSDRRLTALVAAGHDRAFEAIVERYRRPLSRYLRRLLSEQLAEDVLQATLVRAWRALGDGVEVRDLRPWLYRIAHNQAVNALRAAAASLPSSAETSVAASTESAVEAREELRRTLEGIGELPDRQRAALVAVALADRPHADVAAELGLSDGALRQLLLRARTALRTAATALTPYPVVTWLSAGSDVTAARVAEVAAGAGGIGVAVKAGAAVLAAGAVVAGAPALRDEHRPSRATSVTTQQRAVTTVDDPGGEAEPGDDRGSRLGDANRGSVSSGRGSGDDHKSGRGRSGSGHDHARSGRSGSGSSDDSGRSGRSGSGSADDRSERRGSGSAGDDDGTSLGGSGSSGSTGSGRTLSAPRASEDDGGEREGGEDRRDSGESGDG